MRTVELLPNKVTVTTGDMVTVFRRGDDRAAATEIRQLHDRIAGLEKLAREAIGGPVTEFEMLLSSERQARCETERLTAEVERLQKRSKAEDEMRRNVIAEVKRLQADRDAWRAATGLASLTPAEAGAQIDAEDEERLRLQGEVSAARTEAFAHGYVPDYEDDDDQANAERVDCLMKWIAESEAGARRERDEAFGKVKRLQEARFAPIGDNHHNAALCPHCGEPLRKAMDKIKRLQGIVNQVCKVAATGRLPDGDGVNVPTGMWLEQLAVEAAEEE